MTLREVAEAHAKDHKSSLIAGFPSAPGCSRCYLLNRVVEERAELIARSDEDLGITLRRAKKKALLELGLDKVWPVKEKR